jgi:hypothetical protein
LTRFSHNYFVEEEVDMNEWITSWLQYLLAKELPLPCLVQLWDVYFSSEDGLENHIYVCLGKYSRYQIKYTIIDTRGLALLRHYKEALEELEQSEIRALLLRIPMLDINEASYL